VEINKLNHCQQSSRDGFLAIEGKFSAAFATRDDGPMNEEEVPICIASDIPSSDAMFEGT
jgi:hypothetical protein